MLPTRNIVCAILFPMENNFGTWLKQEREKRGLSQSALGVLSGLNRAVVNKLENDPTIQPKPETLIAISKGLKVSRLVVFTAVGWLEDKGSDEYLEEAAHLLSLLEGDDLEEIIQIARMKLDRNKPKHSSRELPRLETHLD